MAVVEGKRLWVKVVKEEVKRKKSEEVAVRGRRSLVMMVKGSSSEEVVVKERTWRRMYKEPLLSKWVSPGKGASGRGSSPRELARGSAERGTVWLWGSGQEALIHLRTRSVFFFFFSPKPRGKNKKTKKPQNPQQNRSQQANEAGTAVGY